MKRAWDPNRWTYRVNEVRDLCWEVIADDQQGTTIRRVEWADGPEELLERVKNEAADITARRRAIAAPGRLNR